MGALWIITAVVFSNILISRCDQTNQTERIHSSGILKIGENYASLKKLVHGDKCSSELESKADLVGESVIPLVNKLLPLSIALQSVGNTEFEMPESLIVEIENSLIPVRDLSTKIKNSPEGGLCNTTKYLHCDGNVEECRCGKSIKPKGYSYAFDKESEICRFDLGSGCLPPELDDLALKCRPGTHCVTPIENVPCDSENMILENVSNPVLSRHVALQKGYLCFCDANTTM